MEYYIDGHNLIPKVNGIRLSDENDEMELLERLQEFSRLSRRKCTVFFDKAPERRTRDEHYGTLHVIYVTYQTRADEEIISRVNKAGKTRAREITVVSSDQHVQWQCRQAGAAILPSEKFAQEMERIFSGEGRSGSGKKRELQLEAKLSPREVDEWLKLFSSGRS